MLNVKIQGDIMYAEKNMFRILAYVLVKVIRTVRLMNI